eukprot:11993714-Alexandrium_andersonii.AAC.1
MGKPIASRHSEQVIQRLIRGTQIKPPETVIVNSGRVSSLWKPRKGSWDKSHNASGFMRMYSWRNLRSPRANAAKCGP